MPNGSITPMSQQTVNGFKRIVKLSISVAFFCCTSLFELLRRFGGGTTPGRCVVIYYHSVPANQRYRFARQMEILLGSMHPIPADSRELLVPGQRYAVVTFDDAFESVLRNALPELEKRRIPATIFAISDVLGQDPGWEGYPERTMTIQELEELPADLVTIGSHTMTHPALPALAEQQVRIELSESRSKLQNLLHREIKLFSFPFGAFQKEMVEWCREAGYDRIFTTLPNFAFANPDEFAVGRVRVDPTDWPLEYRLKLAGAYRWLPWVFTAKKWLLSNRTLTIFLPKKGLLRNG